MKRGAGKSRSRNAVVGDGLIDVVDLTGGELIMCEGFVRGIASAAKRGTDLALNPRTVQLLATRLRPGAARGLADGEKVQLQGFVDGGLALAAKGAGLHAFAVLVNPNMVQLLNRVMANG